MTTKIQTVSKDTLDKMKCEECGKVHGKGSQHHLVLSPRCHNAFVYAVYNADEEVLCIFCCECNKSVIGVYPK